MSVPWVHIPATQTLIVSTLLVPILVSVDWEVVMLGMESLVYMVCDLYILLCPKLSTSI